MAQVTHVCFWMRSTLNSVTLADELRASFPRVKTLEEHFLFQAPQTKLSILLCEVAVYRVDKNLLEATHP